MQERTATDATVQDWAVYVGEDNNRCNCTGLSCVCRRGQQQMQLYRTELCMQERTTTDATVQDWAVYVGEDSNRCNCTGLSCVCRRGQQQMQLYRTELCMQARTATEATVQDWAVYAGEDSNRGHCTGLSCVCRRGQQQMQLYRTELCMQTRMENFNSLTALRYHRRELTTPLSWVSERVHGRGSDHFLDKRSHWFRGVRNSPFQRPTWLGTVSHNGAWECYVEGEEAALMCSIAEDPYDTDLLLIQVLQEVILRLSIRLVHRHIRGPGMERN